MSDGSADLPPWRPLLKAARHREGRSPMSRWLQLATIAADGSPRVRTLVFRGWFDSNTLELLTDQRSAKEPELQQDPRFEICWLLPKARCQFRFRGQQRQLEADLLQQRCLHHWEQLRPEGRALWGWPAPGAPFDHDATFTSAIADGTPMPESFKLLCLEITSVDLLELSGTPHQRRRWRSEDGWIEHPLNP